MGDAPRWWQLLSSSAVLAVLVAAGAAGLARPSMEAAVAGVRRPAAYETSEQPEAVTPLAAPLLAPFSVRAAIASRGELAYALAGEGLTLDDIPSAALVAYQRAATAIDLADPRCHLDWELVAAVGKVASDHARAHGSALDANGVARPAVLGPRLTGRHGTPRVTDTDGGLLDRAPGVDRAVGPMMLLPATWSAVNVDGDTDGRRNPQDVDDAALGVAVFLCAGPGDFRKAAHAREQVRGYHPGRAYARSVLAVRAQYHAAGSLPATTTLLARDATPTVPDVDPTPVAAPTEAPAQEFQPGASPSAPVHGVPSPSSAPTPTATVAPAPTEATTPSVEPEPSESPDPSCGPSGSPTTEPSPSDEPAPTESPSATPSPTASPTREPDPCGTDEPEPTGEPDSVEPAAAVVVVPAAAWLWWRRRRPREAGIAAR